MIGLGTILQVEVDQDAGNWATLPGVVECKPSAAKLKLVDTPYLGQPTAANPREPGTMDLGDLEFTMYYDSAWYSRLGTWAYARAIRRWRVIPPNGDVHGIYAAISQPEIDTIKNDDPVTMKVMVHDLSGTTFTAAPSP